MSGEDDHQVIVVGAGLCGLALAYRLERLGGRVVILDRARRVAEPWRRRHAQLRLNTHRRYSRLPGARLPRGAGVFADRDTIVDYLESYARRTGACIRYGIDVRRIDRDRGAWTVQTAAGSYRAGQVVVATGRERVPVTPEWRGMAGFTGEIVHAADFGHVDDYRDRNVLVIGGGNSGVDILNHLVRIPTRSLAVSVRNGTAVLPARLGGFPVQRLSGLIELLPAPAADSLLAATERFAFGDLGRLGLRRPAQGAATRLACNGVAPAVDDGFVAALRDNRVAALPPVAAFRENSVILADGRKLFPDVVICATGYRPGLEAMVGHLDVLDENGIPRRRNRGGGMAGCPGLWFMGMWPRLAGTFHAACRESRMVAGAIRGIPGARKSNTRLSIRVGQLLQYRE